MRQLTSQYDLISSYLVKNYFMGFIRGSIKVEGHRRKHRVE